MAITLGQIIDAVENTLDAASTLKRSQSYDELTESLQVADLPALQVWPWESAPVDMGGTSDRRTFSGAGGAGNKPVRKKEYTIYADYYAAYKKKLMQDMAAVVDGIDAIEPILEAEDTPPYFGLDGIKQFQWHWNFGTWGQSDPQRPLIGVRFTIRVIVF